MEQLQLPNFKNRDLLEPLPLKDVIDDSVTDFDIYIEIGGHMVLYAPQPYRWNQSEIDRLINDGHIQLFYDRRDKELVSVYHKVFTCSEIDPEECPDQRIAKIMDLTSEFSHILYDHNFTKSALAQGQKISELLVDCLQEKPSCVKALGKLSDHHAYTYYHSGRVAAYSLAIAMRRSLQSEEELQSIALGCLLHDIGKSGVDAEILNKPGPLTDLEWHEVKQHPETGFKMVSDSHLGLVPVEIILHHHEREDGEGYPHQLTASELLTEVRIAAFSDIFDALTSHRPYQKTRSKYEALDFIRFHLLDHVCSESFKALVALLHEEEK